MTDSPDAHHIKEIQKNITHQMKIDSMNSSDFFTESPL